MSLTTKVALGFAAFCIVAVSISFSVSRYLISRLDGTGGVHATATERYSSEDGVSFQYPDTYALSSHTGGTAGNRWDELLLVQKGNEVDPNGTDGEASPAISMSVFQNPKDLSLEQWVQTDARSNFKFLSDPGGMGSATVGGEPALVYKYSGLYETDAVAVAHAGKIFFFEAAWLTPRDPLRTDFANLLNTVHFTQ